MPFSSVFRLDFFLDLLGDDPDSSDLLDGERTAFLSSFRTPCYFGFYFGSWPSGSILYLLLLLILLILLALQILLIFPRLFSSESTVYFMTRDSWTSSPYSAEISPYS